MWNDYSKFCLKTDSISIAEQLEWMEAEESGGSVKGLEKRKWKGLEKRIEESKGEKRRE